MGARSEKHVMTDTKTEKNIRCRAGPIERFPLELGGKGRLVAAAVIVLELGRDSGLSLSHGAVGADDRDNIHPGLHKGGIGLYRLIRKDDGERHADLYSLGFFANSTVSLTR